MLLPVTFTPHFWPSRLLQSALGLGIQHHPVGVCILTVSFHSVSGLESTEVDVTVLGKLFMQ